MNHYRAVDMTASVNGGDIGYDPVRMFTVKAGEVFDASIFCAGLPDIAPAVEDRYFMIFPPDGSCIGASDGFRFRCICAELNNWSGTIKLREFPFYKITYKDGDAIEATSAFDAQDETSALLPDPYLHGPVTEGERIEARFRGERIAA